MPKRHPPTEPAPPARRAVWFPGDLVAGLSVGLHLAFVAQLARFPTARAVVLDLGGLGRIDYTGARTLADIALEAQRIDLAVQLRHAPPQAVRILERVCPDLVSQPRDAAAAGYVNLVDVGAAKRASRPRRHLVRPPSGPTEQ